MRFGRWAAAAVAGVLCATQGQAARYYEFEISGSAQLDQTSQTVVGVNSEVLDDVRFAFDTQATPDFEGDYTSYGTSGGFGFTLFLRPNQDGSFSIFTDNSNIGPSFYETLDPLSVADGNSLLSLVPTYTGFSYNYPILPYRYTKETEPGMIGTFTGRTTDTAPDSLTAVDRAFLSPLPETATWVTMILGLSVAGYMLRRRRAAGYAYAIPQRSSS